MTNVKGSLVYFDSQKEKFVSEDKKCAFLITLLSGWETDIRVRTLFDYFIHQLHEVFEYPAGGRDISSQILQLSQGNHTVTDYTITFRTLAAQIG